MLKIYLCTVEYHLQDKDKKIYLSTDTNYVIKDEADAVEKTKEWGAYTKEARTAYDHLCEFKETKRGNKIIYWTFDGGVYAKEWIAPDAKLVAHTTYKEATCSMRRLMELPAPDVIAYLKQEGLNLSMSS